MKNIREFKDLKELNNYFNDNAIIPIGEGSEGEVYLNRNNEIIKYMIDAFYPKCYEDYKDIIMYDDLKLDSFIFPKELFILDGIIVGCREDYFKGDLFDFDKTNRINIEKLINARNKFIEDTKVITDNGYYLFELCRNILFDNERLVAIDTLDYIKSKDVTLDENIKVIDYAILSALQLNNNSINADNPFEEEIEKVYKLKR